MNQAIWSIALSLVGKHSTSAPYLLHAHIMELRRNFAQPEVIGSWLLVDQAVHELVRRRPRPGERLH